jgi:hypothetical protein
MFNTAKLYELSFVAPYRKLRKHPQLVFALHVKHLPKIVELLEKLVERYEAHAREYCPEYTRLHSPIPDLFGNIEFGYGRCASITTRDEEMLVHVNLHGGPRLRASTLTIHVLLLVFCVLVEDKTPSNQSQQIDIQTRADHAAEVYGHAVSGYVSPSMRRWLLRHVARAKEHSYAPLPQAVADAMYVTWKAVSGAEKMPPKNMFYGSITSDGRFSLNCPGNACDLAIYPDQVYGGIDTSVRFSCHNLDEAHQQLTLLAGLAKLCELARADES